MKELNSCDIAKLSKEELALFGLVEIFPNLEIETLHNHYEEIVNDDCSGIEV